MTVPAWKRRNDAIDYAARIEAIRATEALCPSCQCDAGVRREDMGTMPLPFTRPVYREPEPIIVEMDLSKRGLHARSQPRDERGWWKKASE